VLALDTQKGAKVRLEKDTATPEQKCSLHITSLEGHGRSWKVTGRSRSLVVQRGDLHGLQLVREHAEDLVKLVVALLPVRLRARLPPEQAQCELRAERLQQLRHRLPVAPWWREDMISRFKIQVFFTAICRKYNGTLTVFTPAVFS